MYEYLRYRKARSETGGGDSAPFNDWWHFDWLRKVCGWDFPTSDQIPWFDKVIVKKGKKILSDNEIEKMIDEGTYKPTRMAFTPADVVKLEERAVEQNCVFSAGVLIMIWSSVRPTHIQLCELEFVNLKNKVMGFHCTSGKSRGDFQPFKFQVSLISLSKNPRPWWNVFIKALENRSCKDDDFVFMNEKGGPMTNEKITEEIRNIVSDWLSPEETMMRTSRSARYFIMSIVALCGIGEDRAITAGFGKSRKDPGSGPSMPDTYNNHAILNNLFTNKMLGLNLMKWNKEYGDDFASWSATAMMDWTGKQLAIKAGEDPELIAELWG